MWAEGGAWHVHDLDSANGTFVNRTRVEVSMALPQSSELRFHANGPTVSAYIDTPMATRVS